MSFQSVEDADYDVLFARHSLEHSPYTLLTLLEFNRILKPTGTAYIAMTSPSCTRALEEYDNHYAIMGAQQWRALMIRAGFDTLDIGELKFGISNNQTGEAIGEEVYEWYVLKKS